jgi:hypothetical protein
MTNNFEINNIAPDYELNAKILACFFYNNLRIPYNEFPQLKITGLKALDGSLILNSDDLLRSFGILDQYYNYMKTLRELESINKDFKDYIEGKKCNEKQLLNKIEMLKYYLRLNLNDLSNVIGNSDGLKIHIEILDLLNGLIVLIEKKYNLLEYSINYILTYANSLLTYVDILIKRHNIESFFKLFRNSYGKVLTTGSRITFNYGSNNSKILTETNIHEVLDIPFESKPEKFCTQMANVIQIIVKEVFFVYPY